MKDNKLVVVVMGQNCERFIDMCLDSVEDADELIFCEGLEPSPEINYSESYQIFRRKFPAGHWIAQVYDQEDKTMNGKQRNFYLNYLKKEFPEHWALCLDVDEIVEDLSKVREFIQTADKGVYSVKMRHLIGDFGHEDATVKTHWVPNRLFKIECADHYPEVEHPVLIGKNESVKAQSMGGTDCTTIWHLAYTPNMWEIKKRYDNHLKKSNMHTPEYLKSWYYAHLFGTYPKSQFDPVELPKQLLDKFGVNRDELYFGNRGLEVKHFVDAHHWKEYFKPESVLEVGCGRGPRVAAMRIVGLKCEGIELSQWAVDNAITPIKQGDITKDLEVSPADLVIAYDVLEHLEESQLDSVVNRLINLSNKYLLISVPVIGDPNLMNDKTHKVFRTKDWWNSQFTQKGLTRLETPTHFLFPHQLFLYSKV